MSWAGCTVLVTGASRGLGRYIAKAFAHEGAFVGIGYHRFDREASRTLAEIREGSGSGALVKADVRDHRATNAAITAFVEQGGPIEVLVNNAGVIEDRPFALMSAKSWSTVVETNLGGVFNCSRAVVRSMISRKTGSIVNIGSVAGIKALPGQANYAAAKGGLLAMTRALARELGSHGIRVNAVVPGFLDVGMASRLDRRIAERTRTQIPLGRFGDPREVVEAVLFLASDRARYVTGQSLVVDGGLSL